MGIEERVADAMSEQFGAEVKANLVTKLPNDGTEGHLGLGTWDVYAARCGEFVLVAYVYPDEETIDVEIV